MVIDDVGKILVYYPFVVVLVAGSGVQNVGEG